MVPLLAPEQEDKEDGEEDEQDGEGAHHRAEQGLKRHRGCRWWSWSTCGGTSRRPWWTIHRNGLWRIGKVG